MRTEASTLGQGVAVELAEWLFAVLCNGLGRYHEAVAAAKVAGEDRPGEVFVSAWTAMELLEAATRSDNPDVARLALERIVAATAFAGTDSALGILARCHLALVDHAAGALADLSRARPGELAALALDHLLDLLKVGLGQRQQLLALAGALCGDCRVAAQH